MNHLFEVCLDVEEENYILQKQILEMVEDRKKDLVELIKKEN